MYGKLSEDEEFAYALRRNRSWWRGIVNWGLWALFYGFIGLLALEFDCPRVATGCWCAVMACVIGAVVYYVIFCIGFVKKMDCKDAGDIERYKRDVKRGKYREDDDYGI